MSSNTENAEEIIQHIQTCTLKPTHLHLCMKPNCNCVKCKCDQSKIDLLPECKDCGSVRTPDSWLALLQHPKYKNDFRWMCDRACSCDCPDKITCSDLNKMCVNCKISNKD